MKLRFEVDQAECFRRGIDCPKSIATVDVDPAGLDQKTRELVAERLDGIDVRVMTLDSTMRTGTPGPDGRARYLHPPYRRVKSSQRLKASVPTFDGLLDAVRADNLRIEALIATGEAISSIDAGQQRSGAATREESARE